MQPSLSTYLATHQTRSIDELVRLVKFPSVSAQPDHNPDTRACANWVANHFRALNLSTTIHETDGHPIIVARSTHAIPHAPRVLVYGHYDVQPPEPFDLWQTPPFEPSIRNGNLYGRGASDNKGQFFAHVKAAEAYIRTGTPLPVNLTFLIEGEEEVGSVNLMKFVPEHARELRSDYIIVSDTSMFSKKHPTVTYSTRGLVGFEVRVDGPNRDLHSGVFGGSVTNPVMALAKILAACVDKRGRVAIPGFYDDVKPLAKWERAQFKKLPFNETSYAKFMGVPSLDGESGYSTLERRWARPTFEINGITGGYQGPGAKTIVPSYATAKITCRLVPDQNPQRIARLLTRHLKNICPPSVRISIQHRDGSAAFHESPQGRGAHAAAAALERAYGYKAVFAREGGTLPILDLFKRQLKGEIILVGLGLPDDNWHSPNEKMDLDNYRRGIAMSVELLGELGNHRP
jgi:acetylornithine deacetylase/succinyl-diaminopimelate desuccinylase-like protein